MSVGLDKLRKSIMTTKKNIYSIHTKGNEKEMKVCHYNKIK